MASIRKNINYLGKDFGSLRENLITHIKGYFPDTYQDFSEASPGMMLIETAAYVGDVLNFYLDNSFRELFSDTAKQRKSVLNLAKMFGYKPNASIAANTLLDIFLVVPTSGSVANKTPDKDYCPIITKGMKINSTTNPSVIFETREDINFAVIDSRFDDNPVLSTIYKVDNDNIPTHFLLKKKIEITGNETKTLNQVIGSAQKYLKVQLPSRNVTEIVSVVDSNGNNWYHVDSLAQDTIFIEQQNTPGNDTELSAYSGSVPYLLKLRKVPKRYETTIDENNLTYLLFGSGVVSSNDEEIIPNPSNVGSPTQEGSNQYDYSIDPENFLKTKTFGEAPSNTTLTIKYREGGGVASNVPANTITQISNAAYTFRVNTSILDSAKLSDVKNSISCTNEEPASGGKSEEPLESIKINSRAEMKSQKRCITKEDYIVRAYALSAKFGSIFKVYVEKDDVTREREADDLTTGDGVVLKPKDPLALNMYVLSLDNSGNLAQANLAVKRNLKVYISQYKMITDTINIVDGDIINFKIYFKVISTNKENKREVLLRCIDALKQYFSIDKWNFNQPIVYSQVYEVLNKINGVQSVPSIKFINVAGGNYSNKYVDMQGLTENGIIYPVRSTSIFEIKFENTDIIGTSL